MMVRVVMPGTAAVLSVLAGVAAHAAPNATPAYSCRYPSAGVVAQLKIQVEVLRRIEREAADRLVGLDTRPYDWLLEQARAAEAAIAVPAALAAEADLRRCRNFIRPLRADCATAAAALVRVLAELVAGDAGKEARTALAEAVPHCERWIGLMPLNTRLRSSE
jgi:hypothetical protein